MAIIGGCLYTLLKIFKKSGFSLKQKMESLESHGDMLDRKTGTIATVSKCHKECMD